MPTRAFIVALSPSRMGLPRERFSPLDLNSRSLASEKCGLNFGGSTCAPRSYLVYLGFAWIEYLVCCGDNSNQLSTEE